LRIFDRYGERAKRLKAYEILIKDIGEMNLCDWLMREKQPCRIKP
jgi:hypothetical protein